MATLVALCSASIEAAWPKDSFGVGDAGVLLNSLVEGAIDAGICHSLIPLLAGTEANIVKYCSGNHPTFKSHQFSFNRLYDMSLVVTENISLTLLLLAKIQESDLLCYSCSGRYVLLHR